MRALRWVLCLLLGAAVFASGCRGGCSREKVLAELIETKKAVDRDEAEHVGQWSTATIGATFGIGDGVKTGVDATAVLELDDGSHLRMTPETILRFRLGQASEERNLEIETGSAILEVSDTPVHLRTAMGLAVIEPRSRVSLDRTSSGYRFEVTVGRARLETTEGVEKTLEAGSSFEIGIGDAVVEPAEEKKKLDAPEAGPPVVAFGEGEVTAEIRGGGASVRGADDEAWKRLGPGATTLAGGAALRLARGTSAELSRGSERATLRGAGQFVIGGGGQPLVTAGSGQVIAAGGAVAIAVPGGIIIVDSGGAADLTVGDATGTELDVSSGAVTVVAKQKERVRAGESAVIERDGDVEIGGRSLGYADFALDAGQSVVVHDPAPPTAVRLLIGKRCADGAIVESSAPTDRGSQRARGEGHVTLAFEPGARQYAVRCVEDGAVSKETIASGRVTIVRDSGNVPLPNSAPQSAVETDGRRYTITYQNLLPAVAVSWQRAPRSEHYTLTVSSARGSKTLTTSAPSYRFRSGALLEGTHKVVFATASGAKSRLTTVEVRFDNAAPKAALRSPADRSFAPGATVTVAGVALPGWSVDAGGQRLPTDAQHRFAGKAAAPADLRALAVRFSHPDRGVHYYLRRSTKAQ